MSLIAETLLKKIISGGQTGVDRAALNVAIRMGIPCGGSCPRGRKAEDGVIPQSYPLTETPRPSYEQRTEQNVLDSDGTLILCQGEPTGGTAYTIEKCIKHAKPYLVVDLGHLCSLNTIFDWLHTHRIQTLNVAGPRESASPGIGQDAEQLLAGLLQQN
jgi:hypothetical protein